MLRTAATSFAIAQAIAQETDKEVDEELDDKRCSNVTNVETETTAEASTEPEQTTEKPPPPKLTARTKVAKKNLIPVEEDAFEYRKDGITPRTTKENTAAGRMALYRAVKRLNIAINSPSLNDKQRVVALRTVSTHHKS